jgi:hypothetical protein
VSQTPYPPPVCDSLQVIECTAVPVGPRPEEEAMTTTRLPAVGPFGECSSIQVFEARAIPVKPPTGTPETTDTVPSQGLPTAQPDRAAEPRGR